MHPANTREKHNKPEKYRGKLPNLRIKSLIISKGTYSSFSLKNSSIFFTPKMMNGFNKTSSSHLAHHVFYLWQSFWSHISWIMFILLTFEIANPKHEITSFNPYKIVLVNCISVFYNMVMGDRNLKLSRFVLLSVSFLH